MKLFLLVVAVAVAVASPVPEGKHIGEPVQVIVNGVPEGEPLEIGDLVDIKLNQHIDGELASATNVLHPYSAAGIAEAAIAAADAAANDINPIVPEPVVLPSPAVPEVVPSPVDVVPSPVDVAPSPVDVVPSPVDVIPSPVEVAPVPVVLPEPAVPEVVVPEPVLLPEPAAPEVVLEPVQELPVPVPQIPQGEVYNDGVVQVSVNTPENAGVVTTIQSWLTLVLNYFTDDVQTTQQVI